MGAPVTPGLPKAIKLGDIAARIRAHLQRMETDPALNKQDDKYKTQPFYCANAYAAGRYVGVVYVSYQGATNLSKADALAFLSLLDSGQNVKHYALREKR
jgi:hypothetical protein